VYNTLLVFVSDSEVPDYILGGMVLFFYHHLILNLRYWVQRVT